MMRIGIISPEYFPDLGGVETYALEFAAELFRAGYLVTVYTMAGPATPVDNGDVKVKRVLKNHRGCDLSVLSDEPIDVWHVLNAGYAWVVERLHKPVLLTIHGNDFLSVYFSAKLCDFSKIPVLWKWAGVLDRWMEPVNRWINERALRRSYPKMAHIFANSRYTEQVFLERNPQCKGLTSVSWVGVSSRFLDVQRVTQKNDVLRVLSVCRLTEPRKNIDLVIRSLANLKDRFNFVYIVVGEGWMRSDLEQLSEKLGLGDRVIFTGRVSDTELMNQFAAADLFVLTSEIIEGSHEGFGIVYLEAAATGLPSLAARLAGAAEAVGEGESGFFVEQPTVEAITAKLDSWMAGNLPVSPDSCRQFARKFLWRQVVDKAIEQYQKAGVGIVK